MRVMSNLTTQVNIRWGYYPGTAGGGGTRVKGQRVGLGERRLNVKQILPGSNIEDLSGYCCSTKGNQLDEISDVSYRTDIAKNIHVCFSFIKHSLLGNESLTLATECIIPSYTHICPVLNPSSTNNSGFNTWVQELEFSLNLLSK